MKVIVGIILVLALLFASAPELANSLEEAHLGRETGLTPLARLEFQSTKLVSGLLTGRLGVVARGEDPLMKLGEEGEEYRERRREIGEGEGGPMIPALQAPGAAGILVPFRSPAPAFSRNIIITRDFSRAPIQTEPHIAVNPKNPNHLLVGVIDYNFAGVSAYVSLDGGETWIGPRQLRYLKDDQGSGGDPVVAFDREGNAYFASISIGVEEFRIGTAVSEEVVSSIVVAKSVDGGFTWSEPISVARSGITFRNVGVDERGRLRGSIAFSFLDKPWMDVGPDKADPRRDAIYVTYTEFAVVWDIFYVEELVFLGNPRIESVIKLVKSSTDFTVMTPPIQISPVVVRGFGEEAAQKRVVQGSQPAVAPDGTVYVAWLDTLDDDSAKGLGEIHVSRSADGGRTWSRPIRAAVFNEVSFLPRNAAFRNWGSSFPQMAVGPAGEVYIVFVGRPADKQLDDGDIYFVRSLDGGATWSQPKRLNDDETSRLQFFPSVTVDPKGVVHVMWGDMRDDPVEIKYHIYYTTSQDKGETWGFEIPELRQRFGSTRVTDAYSNPNYGFPGGRFIGDYFSIKATAEDVYMVWADCRLGEFIGVNQKIAFARRRAMTAPSIFVSPPTGVAGRDITIVGSNFQPDSNIYIELSGSVVAYTKTTEEGAFAVRIFTPLTSEGPQTLVAYDQTGNAAVASFYIEFGFNTLADKVAALESERAVIRNLTAEIRELSSAMKAGGSGASNGGREDGQTVELPWIILTAVAGVAAGLAAGLILSKRLQKKKQTA
ncbi:MAG: sialidase family protein [Nitrososphaerota archaeon]|nr:glycoside hydrolase [Candidatus Calditenuaceae archaeon]MDW8073264.1 sialidase family protein [Nitrososphaerota archaeon]